ncbi:hypothetical protein BpHYR1_015102 [Brachionus plicatilis]|uniref:Uncharacterized protein n=1 Tax=Brachionus plicatilis TaxID=10195 RepID=A0A3M7RN66_BRAPC|nr:hypothetical protein BpHYR1_015102 [Brachionus plicatilis]
MSGHVMRVVCMARKMAWLNIRRCFRLRFGNAGRYFFDLFSSFFDLFLIDSVCFCRLLVGDHTGFLCFFSLGLDAFATFSNNFFNEWNKENMLLFYGCINEQF